ncbi:MAG: Gfo/Idh/MocA family oxidoreductase [Lentisphaeria bacterium]|nr:Gfo/Idh/MocA family oxidoreductase [Lentisphaeria bacterium]
MNGKAKVRVGVIGAGGMCNSVHLPSLKDMEDVEVVALCDLVEEKARRTAERFGVPSVYVSYHRMFAEEDLNAVFCLVEPSNHFHVVIAALQAGLDVFMEKPPGVTSFQAEGMMRKAEEKDRLLMVGFNRRFIPLVREIKKAFEARTRITQVEGCFYKYGSGAFDRGGIPAFESDTIHAIDLVRWMAAGEPVEAHTLTASHQEPVTNAWNSVTRFDNGTIGLIKANYRTGGRVHRFEMHGPGCSAFLNLGMGGAQCEGLLLRHDGKQQYSLSAGAAAANSGDYFSGVALADSDQFYRFYGFYFEDRHFIDCVRSRTTPETSIQDAVKTFRYVDLILAGKH